MKKQAKKNKKKLKWMNTRRGVVLVAIVAMTVLVINIISASFSWFTPQSDTKSGMVYSFDGKMRSESCSMSTFRGTKVTSSNIGNYQGEYINQIHYNASASTGSVPVSAGQTEYFKTEIINSDTKNASDISLYITTMPACTLAVTYPGNSVRKFSSTQSDCYIVRDAYVKKYVSTDVNGPGKLEIEWFVINNGSSAITVNLNNLYLLYN